MKCLSVQNHHHAEQHLYFVFFGLFEQTIVEAKTCCIISDVHVELNITSAIILAKTMPATNQQNLAILILICSLKHRFTLGDVHHGLAIVLEILGKVRTKEAWANANVRPILLVAGHQSHTHFRGSYALTAQAAKAITSGRLRAGFWIQDETNMKTLPNKLCFTYCNSLPNLLSQQF